jgi:hypothetical protein
MVQLTTHELYIIASFLAEPEYIIRPWIPQHLLNQYLGYNPHAIDYLRQHPHLISSAIANNPSGHAVTLMFEHGTPYGTYMVTGAPSVSPLGDILRFSSWLSNLNNDEAMAYLTAHPWHIDWALLSGNPHPIAMSLLKSSPHRIDYTLLSSNTHPDAIRLLETTRPDKLCPMFLNMNASDAALEWLTRHPDTINWNALCYNTNEKAMRILALNPDAINYAVLCAHTSDGAKKLLENHEDEIWWRVLSANSSDWALTLLEAHEDLIDWPHFALNTNPRAMAILERNPHRIYANELSQNPSIFETRTSKHNIAAFYTTYLAHLNNQ